jgi:hypothetical protein
MNVETKVKIVLPLIGAFVLVSMYLTWEWDFNQILLSVVAVFFLITPLMKWKTISKIGEHLSRAWF